MIVLADASSSSSSEILYDSAFYDAAYFSYLNLLFSSVNLFTSPFKSAISAFFSDIFNSKAATSALISSLLFLYYFSSSTVSSFSF